MAAEVCVMSAVGFSPQPPRKQSRTAKNSMHQIRLICLFRPSSPIPLFIYTLRKYAAILFIIASTVSSEHAKTHSSALDPGLFSD